MDDPINLLFSLTEGFLAYHKFPKIQQVDELILENNIIDFHPYLSSPIYSDNQGEDQDLPYLATLHRSPKELKIFRLRRSRLEFKYLTKLPLIKVPLGFTVYRDIFIVTYKDKEGSRGSGASGEAEYIRVDNKGRDIESVTRFILWSKEYDDESDSRST